MKAVLIIDMPEEYMGSNIDVKLYGKYQTVHERYVNKLRPLPSKKDVTVKRIEDIQSYSITEVADNISARIILKTNEIFALGWNACLDTIIGIDCINEITGETE